MPASSRSDLAVTRRTGSLLAKTVSRSPGSGCDSSGGESTSGTSQSAQLENPSRYSDPQLGQNMPSPSPGSVTRLICMALEGIIFQNPEGPAKRPLGAPALPGKPLGRLALLEDAAEAAGGEAVELGMGAD